jgi:hypothetical protein
MSIWWSNHYEYFWCNDESIQVVDLVIFYERQDIEYWWVCLHFIEQHTKMDYYFLYQL